LLSASRSPAVGPCGIEDAAEAPLLELLVAAGAELAGAGADELVAEVLELEPHPAMASAPSNSAAAIVVRIDLWVRVGVMPTVPFVGEVLRSGSEQQDAQPLRILPRRERRHR
jgi:hypothetical protein